jgi:peptidyl-prolyl cis-trans isomerase SurA
MRRLRPFLLAALLGGTALLARPRDAHAIIIERIVAVVGERPILLSDLQHRAKPAIIVSIMQSKDGRYDESKLYRSVLDHMIEERLVEQAAERARLSVSVDEIDKAIAQKAAELHINVRELVTEAQREGLTEQDYRDEIRRQLLEGKLVQLRVAGRVRVTETDARNTYVKWSKQFAEQQPVEVRTLALQLLPDPAAIAAREALAQDIVIKARTGTDFCELVRLHSDDVSTKDACGYRGIQPLKNLLAPLQEQIAGLKDGETSNPVRFGDQAIVILQLVRRPQVPPFEQVKAQMLEAAAQDAFTKQRDAFLAELRRATFVEVRLNS